VPLGALARLELETLTLTARLLSADGRTVLETNESGPSSEGEELATRAAEELRSRGADRILSELRPFPG
jgi:porphobilinogen deaminase